ncbi:LexA family transcriptional regulator [Nitrospinae bacterium AH_259_B05_G02_I21]|nr:LexA family transcriptional regulator [Nitrospinae bacterium AH_259_B05_G02_I21]
MRDREGLTQKKFADRLSIDRSHLSHVERGEKRPSGLLLLAIQSVFGATEDWLVRGRGPMLRKPQPRFAEERAPYGARPVELKVVSRRELENLERWDVFAAIPLVRDEAAAGTPRAVSDEDIEGFCLVNQGWAKRPEDYICVRVKGDSMEPVLPGGSIVAVHLKSRDPARLIGKIVAARHGGGVTVKELRRSDDRQSWFLLPYNKEYAPLVVSPEEESPIIGKVAWWWARQE